MSFRHTLVAMALVAGSLGIALLLAEGLVRVVAPVPLIPQMYTADPHTIFRSKPNVREKSRLAEGIEWEWATNSLGFRGSREYFVPKPSGTRRVLVLGDSFTFGFGVGDAETYAARLEQHLDSACIGIEIEVVNAGVSGFSTSQELALLEQEGPRLAPDVVVVGFFINDPEDNIDKAVHALSGDSLVRTPATAASAYGGVTRAKAIANAIPGYEWLVRRSMLINLLRRAYFASRDHDARAHPPRWGMAGPAATSPDSAATDRQWQLVERLYERIRDTTEAMGGKLVVLLIPDDSALVRYATGRSQAAEALSRMRGVCTSAALACVDMAEALGTRLDVAAISTLYLREGHFSVGGHHAAADVLAPLARRGLGCDAQVNGK